MRISYSLIDDVVYSILLVAIALITYSAIRPIPGATLSDIFILVCLALAPIVKRKRWIEDLPTVFCFSAMLFLLAGPTTALFSDAPVLSFISFSQLYLAMFLSPITIAYIANSKEKVRGLVYTWVFFAIINVASGLTDLVGLTTIAVSFDLATVNDGYWRRAFGLTVHPNHYGLIAAMTFPLIVVLGCSKGLLWRTTFAGLSMICVLGVLASGSRALIVSLGIGVISMCFLSKRATYQSLYVLLVSAVALLTFAVFVPDVAHQISIGWMRLTDGVLVQNSNIDRIDLVRRAIFDFVKSPFIGVGFQEITTAHNVSLQLLQSGGILSFFGFIVYLGGTILVVRRLFLRDLDADTHLLLKGLVCVILIWLITGFVQNQLVNRYLYFPFGLILALWIESRSVRAELPGTDNWPARNRVLS